MAMPKSLVVTVANGETVWDSMYAPLREFKSGSDGYFAGGKVIDRDSGERYQVSCSIVRIGSKPQKTPTDLLP